MKKSVPINPVNHSVLGISGDELDSLGRIVNAFLDLAEERAKRKIPMTTYRKRT